MSPRRQQDRRNGRRFTVAEGDCPVHRRRGSAPLGRLIDLSLSGLKLEADHGLRVGDTIDLELSPAAAQSICASARVCRVAPSHCHNAAYGVEFIHLDPPERRALHAFLLRLRRLDWDDTPVEDRPIRPERVIWVHSVEHRP